MFIRYDTLGPWYHPVREGGKIIFVKKYTNVYAKTFTLFKKKISTWTPCISETVIMFSVLWNVKKKITPDVWPHISEHPVYTI